MQGDVNDNQLIGNEGDNIIQSLAGNDTLVGNAGSDTLTGGLGSDTFDYNSNNDGHDIITDFNLSEGDKLDISDLIDYQVNNNLADFVSVENIGNCQVSPRCSLSPKITLRNISGSLINKSGFKLYQYSKAS